MDQNTYNTQLMLEIPNVQIFEIQGKYQKLIQSGSLQILEIDQYNITILKLDNFQYTLQKNIPVMTQQTKSNIKMYIFPCVEQLFYGIVMDQSQKDLVSVYEFILSNKCHFVQPIQDYNNIQQQPSSKQQINQQEKFDITDTDAMLQSRIVKVDIPQYGAWNNVSQGQVKSSQTADIISGYIQKGGELIKDGVIYGAGLLSQGVQIGGQFIQSKIKPDEKQQEIDPSTINKVKLAKTGTNAMLVFTKAQVDALIKMGTMVADEAGKQISQSETGLKIQSYEHYNDAKSIGKATLYAVVTVYDGLYQALSELGATLAQQTTNVINKKYGQQAGELSKESFEVVGNVGKLTEVYEYAAAQALLEGTKPENQIKAPSDQNRLQNKNQKWGN